MLPQTGRDVPHRRKGDVPVQRTVDLNRKDIPGDPHALKFLLDPVDAAFENNRTIVQAWA